MAASGFEATGDPQIIPLATAAAVAEEGAKRLLAGVHEALAVRSVAHVALTGGSTAPALYQRLVRGPGREAVDWERIHLWWGDERYVPRDDPLSNASLADDELLRTGARGGVSGEGAQGTDVAAGDVAGLPIPATQVHPWPAGEAIGRAAGPDWAALQYAKRVHELVPVGTGEWPVFDLVLLGVGPDGHILACFPDSPALAPQAPLAMGIAAPQHVEPHVPRMTLNPHVVTAARGVLVMAVGSAKAVILRRVLTEPWRPRELPAQLARRPEAAWLLDEAAASELPR